MDAVGKNAVTRATNCVFPSPQERSAEKAVSFEVNKFLKIFKVIAKNVPEEKMKQAQNSVYTESAGLKGTTNCSSTEEEWANEDNSFDIQYCVKWMKGVFYDFQTIYWKNLNLLLFHVRNNSLFLSILSKVLPSVSAIMKEGQEKFKCIHYFFLLSSLTVLTSSFLPNFDKNRRNLLLHLANISSVYF